MNLQELKKKSAELINEAEKLGIENQARLENRNSFCYLKKIS